jgi:FAD-dependent urate hydroxylase
VGASNALRAASALADELSRADAGLIPTALDLYVKRCLKIVWGNRDDSRLAARYMFVESRLVGWGRDEIIKHYPAHRMLSQIAESMHQPF